MNDRLKICEGCDIEAEMTCDLCPFDDGTPGRCLMNCPCIHIEACRRAYEAWLAEKKEE